MLDRLSPFDRQAVALALYRMLTGPRYDIGAVRQALRVCGQRVASRAPGFDALRLHHCADFAEMPPGFHARIVQATLALFAQAPPPPHRGAVEGDDVLRTLATTAGLDGQDAPRLQDLDAPRANTPSVASSGDGQAGREPTLA